MLKLDLIILNSDVTKLQQLDNKGRFLYSSNPDACCRINKVYPIDKIIPQYDIWINGVRSEQSKDRARLTEFENTNYNCIRYHPMLS